MAVRSDPMVPWKGPRNNNGDGNNQGGNTKPRATTLPAFNPGQLNALANQLSVGFGGSVDAWKEDLRASTDPTRVEPWRYGGGGGGKGKGDNRGNNNGGRDPRLNPNTNPGINPGGFNPTRPQHAQMPAQMPMPTQDLQRRAQANMEMSPALNTAYMQQRMQSQMPSSPFGFGSNQMQAQTPGLLGSMMPQQSQMQQQSQPRGLLSNDIPPEVMQLIMRSQSRT